MSHTFVDRHQLCLCFDRANVLINQRQVTLTWRFLESKSPHFSLASSPRRSPEGSAFLTIW